MPSLADERRAIGRSMVQQRTGQSTVDALNRVVTRQKAQKTLRQLDPRGVIPAQRGRADYAEARPGGSGSGSGSGVAWPLTEQNYAQREYHPQGEFTSDGLFYLPAIKKIVFTDSAGAVGEVLLAAPPAPVTP